MARKRVGVIVNPIAGMGGKVGLKGSDGEDTLKLALSLGAVPECPDKAIVALKEFKNVTSWVEFITYPSIMGEKELREAGLAPWVTGTINPEKTGPEDTIRAARELRALGVDLILFAGGDGTARNIFDALGEEKLAVLGIPGGVKIHSGVYAINPKTAGKLCIEYLSGKVRDLKRAEVMDIDEDVFRNQERVAARLYGYLYVPNEKRMVQNNKSGKGYTEESALDELASYVASLMGDDDETVYIVGTGSTTKTVLDKMGLKGTLLGVDIVYRRQLVRKDINESGLLEYLARCEELPVKIIVTVIGGQGYIFGRGNQQISSRVIRKVGVDNVIIVASEPKMLSFFGRSLLVDTGDEHLNEELCGYRNVITGFEKSVVARIT